MQRKDIHFVTIIKGIYVNLDLQFLLNNRHMQQKSLKQFIYLSLAAAVATILLKFYAFYLTGSTGFFSMPWNRLSISSEQ